MPFAGVLGHPWALHTQMDTWMQQLPNSNGQSMQGEILPELLYSRDLHVDLPPSPPAMSECLDRSRQYYMGKKESMTQQASISSIPGL